MTETDNIEYDFMVLKLDESHDWRDAWNGPVPEIVSEQSVGRLFGCYLVDMHRKVHLCEFQASFECHFIETQTEKEPENEETFEYVREGDSQSPLVSYFHVYDLIYLPTIVEPNVFFPAEVDKGAFFPAFSYDNGGNRMRMKGEISGDADDVAESYDDMVDELVGALKENGADSLR